MSSSRLATGDLIRTAVALVQGSAPDVFLEWLSARVWALRASREVPCGAAGAFTTTADRGTVEIRPGALAPLKASRRQLDFRASTALEAAVAESSPERLAALDTDDPLASALAQIGNFGAWSIGKKPTLETFVRFRSNPAINQRL